MNLDPKSIPPHIIPLMSLEERRRYGLIPAQDTGGGVPEGEEDKLQRLIAGWLTVNGVRFINPPMHLKSTLPPGWPDFTFCIRGRPFAIECKTKAGKCTPEQLGMQRDLKANGWTVAVVRDFAGFLEVIEL